jgi:hypothetical protein
MTAINSEIDVTVFDKPSGNVRGMVNAFMQVKGKQKRVANATVLVDEAPVLMIDAPKKLTLAELEAFSNTITLFTTKVLELTRES